jgi:hypothetical protein
VLFNNTLTAIDVKARVQNSRRTSFTATLTTYGKAQYDCSKSNHWVGPVVRSLGRVAATVPLALPAYSVCVLTMSP